MEGSFHPFLAKQEANVLCKAQEIIKDENTVLPRFAVVPRDALRRWASSCFISRLPFQGELKKRTFSPLLAPSALLVKPRKITA